MFFITNKVRIPYTSGSQSNNFWRKNMCAAIVNQVSEWVMGPSMSTLSSRVQNDARPVNDRIVDLYRMSVVGRNDVPSDKNLFIQAYQSIPEEKRNTIEGKVYDFAFNREVENESWIIVPAASNNNGRNYVRTYELDQNSPTFGQDQIMEDPFIESVEAALYEDSGLEDAWKNSLIGRFKRSSAGWQFRNDLMPIALFCLSPIIAVAGLFYFVGNGIVSLLANGFKR